MDDRSSMDDRYFVPMDDRYVPLEIEQPVLDVPLSEGDHVLIHTRSRGGINMKVVDIDAASGTIYGWLVPDGLSPWKVEESERFGVTVFFDEIEKIEISQVYYSHIIPPEFSRKLGAEIRGLLFIIAIALLIA